MTKKRILIVEDEAITALDEAQIMRDLDYEVTGIVLSGEAAVQRVGVDQPNLVLMDIKLMGDMDGREAALKIRVLHQIPVIYVTAFGDKEMSKSGNFTAPKGIGYIVKPFSREELKGEIERLIG